nr:MBL fold metallo-hydrolase [Alteraurantiacibacter buctensis]
MPSAARAEPANLLVRNGSAHLVDVGDGAATAMTVAGADFQELRSIWISHIHFDHIGGLFGALGLRLQTRGTGPLTIYGPPGTRAIVDGLIAAMQPSARSGFGVPGEVPIDPGASITVVELDDGDVVTLDDFTVRVASNTHYSFLPGSANERDFRSLSFRFDLPQRSIVYTGDTGPSDKVTALAQGADMLVTEMIDVEATIANVRRRAPQLSPAEAANMERHLREHHVTTADIGMMAHAAGVGEVVVTHLAGGEAQGERDAAARYAREIGNHYSGRVRVANDQDRF